VGGRPQSILKKDFSRQKNFDGFDVSVEVDSSKIVAGKDVHVKYHFEKDGKGVLDFEPYLAAPMHFAIVSADLSSFAHTHGGLSLDEKDAHGNTHGFMVFPHAVAHGPDEDGKLEDSRVIDDGTLPNNFGPDIFLHHTFSHPGIYVIFGEIKYQGNVIVTRFMFEVTSSKSEVSEAHTH
jgi:hypothetical protein